MQLYAEKSPSHTQPYAAADGYNHLSGGEASPEPPATGNHSLFHFNFPCPAGKE